MKTKLQLFWFVCFLCACSSSPQPPAPVVEVYSGKTYRDYKKQSLSATQYKVAPGDTLYSIAFRAGKDFRDIAAINNISKPYLLQVGKVIKLTSNGQFVKNTTKKSSISSSSKKRNRSHNSSGTTSNEKVKKSVATSKKQEYVANKGYKNVNKTVTEQSQAYSRKVSKWIWPASGKVITRFSTAVQGSKGIDIAGQTGQRVIASADGKVVYAGNALRGFGNLVIIKHSEDYLSAYAHNNKIVVKEQQWVKAGELVALMGNTDAPRVQLHFEIRYRGKSVDPMKFLPGRS